jgi:hypothetical protein
MSERGRNRKCNRKRKCMRCNRNNRDDNEKDPNRCHVWFISNKPTAEITCWVAVMPS